MDKLTPKIAQNPNNPQEVYMFGCSEVSHIGPGVFFQIRSILEGFFLGIEVKLYEEILGCPGTEVRINGS